MTLEAQRIAIATACGWTPSPNGQLTRSPCGLIGPFIECPDYLNDLNAMHGAEKVLTDDEWERYEADLWQIGAPGAVVQASMPIRYQKAFLSATASQRAEAFLRTLGLWTT